jgi:PIN domain nuclease of toxin-antitoxin system
MRYILDTHALLWFINGEGLPENIALEITEPNNNIYLSIASIWEIAIKYSLGKLTMQIAFNDIREFLVTNNVTLLPIEFPHIQELIELPFNHNDPFDRIIIAQSIYEKLDIITKDGKFKDYPVKIIWGNRYSFPLTQITNSPLMGWVS